MFLGERVLAIVPARSGSKAIKNKNIVDLGGKPLLGWTIEAAKIAPLLMTLLFRLITKRYYRLLKIMAQQLKLKGQII